MISEKNFVYYLNLATISFEIVSREEYNMPQNMEIHFLKVVQYRLRSHLNFISGLEAVFLQFQFQFGEHDKITFSCIMLVAHLLKPILYRP